MFLKSHSQDSERLVYSVEIIEVMFIEVLLIDYEIYSL